MRKNIVFTGSQTGYITRNYRQTERSHYRMKIVVSSIDEVSMNKIALWICIGVDDLTAERAIIASNEADRVLI